MRPNLSHLTLLKHNDLLCCLQVNVLVIHNTPSTDVWVSQLLCTKTTL